MMLLVAMGLLIYGAVFGGERTSAILTGGVSLAALVPVIRADEARRKENGGGRD